MPQPLEEHMYMHCSGLSKADRCELGVPSPHGTLLRAEDCPPPGWQVHELEGTSRRLRDRVIALVGHYRRYKDALVHVTNAQAPSRAGLKHCMPLLAASCLAHLLLAVLSANHPLQQAFVAGLSEFFAGEDAEALSGATLCSGPTAHQAKADVASWVGLTHTWAQSPLYPRQQAASPSGHTSLPLVTALRTLIC